MCAVVVNYTVFVKELSEVPTDFSVFSLAINHLLLIIRYKKPMILKENHRFTSFIGSQLILTHCK